MLTAAVREIYKTNLAVKSNERVLVFTDRPTKKDTLSDDEIRKWSALKDILMLVEETGRAFCKEILSCIYTSRGGHGKEPPEKLWRLAFGDGTIEQLNRKGLLKRLINKRISPEMLKEIEEIIRKNRDRAVDAVIALSYYSTSHTRFRDLLTRVCKARYASMPLFDVEMFEGPMSVDWKALQKRTRKIQQIVNMATEVSIRTGNGTEIRLSKKGRRARADSGNLRRPGSFGNLPAGEVFFAPLEGSARGTMVLEWAPTRKLESRIYLTVKDGLVVSIDGKEPFAGVLKEKLSERPENANIAEVGIGTNDRASRPDNILESEKILGTIHIALGDNSSFGGRISTPFHQDFVFFHPTVTLHMKDGKRVVLLKAGRLRKDLV